MNNLLLDEPPLLVMPSLATLIGLNESIVLQQVHYWLKVKEKAGQDCINGHYWVYNTYEQWQEQFPFFSLRTLRRIFTSLEKKGLLIAGNFNKAGFDKTKWYTINYQELKQIALPAHISNSTQTGVQNEYMCQAKMATSSGQYGTLESAKMDEPITENTFTKITTESATHNGAISSHYPSPSKNEQLSFNWSALEKQIVNSCQKYGIQDCEDHVCIIAYYYQSYMKIFRKKHPWLSISAMDKVVKALIDGSENVPDVDFDIYKAMIDKHFITQYDNCDYNICHFMTEGIRNNRFYEVCY